MFFKASYYYLVIFFHKFLVTHTKIHAQGKGEYFNTYLLNIKNIYL